MSEAAPMKSARADESERVLLGQMMLWPETCIEIITATVGPDDFFDPKRREIFKAILAHDEETGGAFDLPLFADTLERAGTLKEVGGREALVELTEQAANQTTAAYHAKRVREASQSRRLVAAARGVLRRTAEGPFDVQVLTDDTAEELMQISEALPGQTREVLQVHDALKAAEGAGTTGQGAPILSGLCDLDRMTGGFRPGQMIVLAAKTSFGKSSMALGMARHAAHHGEPAAIVSTEMAPEEIARRVLVAEADIDADRYREGALSPDATARIETACTRMKGMPLFLVDAAGMTLGRFRASVKHAIRRHKVRLFVLDYLQQMVTGHREESQQVEVAKLSRAMKQTAREERVAIIVLSQLSRKADGKEEPRLGDLRASGTIEEDADTVLLIHRTIETPARVTLIIAKQRNGPTGRIHVVWDARWLIFRNHSPREVDEAVRLAQAEGRDPEPVRQYFHPAEDETLPF